MPQKQRKKGPKMSVNATVAIPITSRTNNLLPALNTCRINAVPEVVLCDYANQFDAEDEDEDQDQHEYVVAKRNDKKSEEACSAKKKGRSDENDDDVQTWYEQDDAHINAFDALGHERIKKFGGIPCSVSPTKGSGLLWTLSPTCYASRETVDLLMDRISKGAHMAACKPAIKLKTSGIGSILLFFYFMIEWWHLWWSRSFDVAYIDKECCIEDFRNAKYAQSKKEQKRNGILAAAFASRKYRQFILSPSAFVEVDDAWYEFRYRIATQESVSLFHWFRCFVYFVFLLYAPTRMFLFQRDSMTTLGIRVVFVIWLLCSVHLYTICSRYFRGLSPLFIVGIAPIAGPVFFLVYFCMYMYSGTVGLSISRPIQAPPS